MKTAIASYKFKQNTNLIIFRKHFFVFFKILIEFDFLVKIYYVGVSFG